MRLNAIPAWTENMAVRAAVADVLLSEADTAEFLSEEGCGYTEHISDLYGTVFEDIIPALISSHSGESCGNMYGKIYKFTLTPELKTHIRSFGPEGMFIDKDSNVVLQNLCLYKGGELLFSCVSHEVFSGWEMDEIDGRLRERVLAAAYAVLAADDTFKEMQSVCEGLINFSRKQLEEDIALLYNLCNYVDMERKYFVYCEPARRCTYKQFCAVAKKYLTADIVAQLEKCGSFFALYPYEGPATAEDDIADNAQYKGRFQGTPMCKRVELELCYIKTILGLPEGMGKRAL